VPIPGEERGISVMNMGCNPERAGIRSMATGTVTCFKNGIELARMGIGMAGLAGGGRFREATNARLRLNFMALVAGHSLMGAKQGKHLVFVRSDD